MPAPKDDIIPNGMSDENEDNNMHHYLRVAKALPVPASTSLGSTVMSASFVFPTTGLCLVCNAGAFIHATNFASASDIYDKGSDLLASRTVH